MKKLLTVVNFVLATVLCIWLASLYSGLWLFFNLAAAVCLLFALTELTK